MNEEQQDLAWASLPREERHKIISVYACKNDSNTPYNEGYRDALRQLYGHHNLTSDTEPEEMLMNPRKEVQEYFTEINKTIDKTTDRDVKLQSISKQTALKALFGDKCLPDKEPPVQGEPKFKIGDKVRTIKDGLIWYVAGFTDKYIILGGENGCIKEFSDFIQYDKSYKTYRFTKFQYIESYTESETKSMQLSDVKDKIDEYFDNYTEEKVLEALERHGAIETIDTMEEKELNLCELLKDCKGEEFYLLDCGNAILDGVQINNARGDSITFLSFHSTNFDSGAIIINPNGKRKVYGSVILYPSRALYEKYPLDAYSAWMEWKDERKPKRWRAEKGECYWFFDRTYTPYQQEENGDIEDEIMYDAYNYFRTKEEVKQATEAVRECLEKFHEKNIKK